MDVELSFGRAPGFEDLAAGDEHDGVRIQGGGVLTRFSELCAGPAGRLGLRIGQAFPRNAGILRVQGRGEPSQKQSKERGRAEPMGDASGYGGLGVWDAHGGC
jgi:hypothetical protein